MRALNDKEINKFHIAIEGIDGSGKSTIAENLPEALKEYLNQMTRAKLTFDLPDRSPYNYNISNYVHDIMQGIEKFTHPVAKDAALLKAFISDHILHSETVYSATHINTDNRNFVISDRYIYSTIAYQGVNMDFEEIVKEVLASPIYFPGLVIFIDTDVEIALNRVNKRHGAKECFENEKYLQTVRENYLRLKEGWSDVKFVIINGNNSHEKVLDDVVRTVTDYMLITISK